MANEIMFFIKDGSKLTPMWVKRQVEQVAELIEEASAEIEAGNDVVGNAINMAAQMRLEVLAKQGAEVFI